MTSIRPVRCASWRWLTTWLLTVAWLTAAPRSLEQAAETAASAKIWLERRAEIESHLREADIVGMKDIGTGVTNPKRADLAPGGPVDRMAWKPIKPGMYRGFWENYKSEIAAYELDKILGLDMVPPTVERRVKGDLGAAIMWATPTQSFKDLGGPPTPPTREIARWTRQLVRAKMFDNLIYNKDPNLGNWLVDPAWNLILIDHTRAFTPSKDMAHEMTRVDQELWERMQALTEESLTAALGNWLERREIRAIIERREKMAGIIQQLVASKGETAVFVR